MPSARSRHRASDRFVRWVQDATLRDWVKRTLLAGLAGFLVLVLLFAFAYIFVELPDDPPRVQTSTILAADGSKITELYKDQNRVDVPLDKVAKVMQRAVVATEDRNFYRHRGLDPIGITRAIVQNVRRRDTQGGSTITQQLVKNAYLTSERTLVRKAKEAVLAVKVEQQYDKDEILERYLNTIYFGRGAYGVEKASQLYFGRSAAELDLPQAALLAGLIRAPESADPIRNVDRALQRRSIALNAMVRNKMITRTEADAAARAPLGAIERPDLDASLTGSTAYFSVMVRQWTVREFGERLAFGGGLQIETTLDPKRQAAAEKAITDLLTEPDDPDVALVSMADDGAVVALIGGRDFKKSNVNLAISHENIRPQAGSTFKPFVLAAALAGDVPLTQRYPGPAKKAINFPGFPPYEVNNYGGEAFGTIDLTEATTRSVNTVYAQLAADVGLQDVAATAQDLGITSSLRQVPAMSLGASNVSPYEMVRAYMTFANRGERMTPYFVKRVTDHNGNVLFEADPERDEVYPEEYADVVNHVLSDVIKKGTGRAASIGKPAAGKTGTTTGNTDAWFVGYTPKLGTAVWMGYGSDTRRGMDNVHGRAVTGGSFPAQIWQRYMRAATQGIDTGNFTAPDPELLRPPEEETTTSTEPEESTTSSSEDSTTSSSSSSSSTTTTTQPRGTTTTTSTTSTTSPPTSSTSATTSTTKKP